MKLLVYTTHLHDPLTGTHTTHLHEEREREDGGQEGLWGPAHEQRSHDQQEEGDGDRPHGRDDEAVDEVEFVHARQVERGQQVEVEDLG